MQMMHGNDWNGQDVSGWYASEKLDGWRACWTGSELVTRSGLRYACPDSFTSALPKDVELDCEVWAGRGLNHSDVHKLIAANQWNKIRVVAFDVPGFNFTAAMEFLANLKDVESVTFSKVESTDSAKQLMQAIKAQGGEGIMLRQPESDYLPYRCDSLLKMK